MKKILKNHNNCKTPAVWSKIIRIIALIPVNTIQIHIILLNKANLSQWKNRNSLNTKNNMETHIKWKQILQWKKKLNPLESS